jgi:hypothetical protein
LCVSDGSRIRKLNLKNFANKAVYLKFRNFWDILRAAPIIRAMMEAARTSETSVDISLTTRQYIPEDSELHTRRRENLKSHKAVYLPVKNTASISCKIRQLSVNSVIFVSGWMRGITVPTKANTFFFLAAASKPSLGPTESPVQWGSGTLSRG